MSALRRCASTQPGSTRSARALAHTATKLVAARRGSRQPTADRRPVPPMPFSTSRAQRASRLALERRSASPSSRRVEVARRERAPGPRAGARVAPQGHALAAAQLPVGARRGRPPGAPPRAPCPADRVSNRVGRHAGARAACAHRCRSASVRHASCKGGAGARAVQSGWRSACSLGRRAEVLKGDTGAARGRRLWTSWRPTRRLPRPWTRPTRCWGSARRT